MVSNLHNSINMCTYTRFGHNSSVDISYACMHVTTCDQHPNEHKSTLTGTRKLHNRMEMNTNHRKKKELQASHKSYAYTFILDERV